MTFTVCHGKIHQSTIFKNGKPSISIGHVYFGYVSHNQMVTVSYLEFPDHMIIYDNMMIVIEQVYTNWDLSTVNYR